VEAQALELFGEGRPYSREPGEIPLQRVHRRCLRAC
jgi:hypothetical protein